MKALRDGFKRRWKFKEKTWVMFVVMGLGWIAWDASPVVWNVKAMPETWCRGPNFVQARIHGMKVKSLKPVTNSWFGRAHVGGFVEDVGFQFVNDATPGSAKPKWASDFGVWRWYDRNARAVQMTMLHADPNDLLWSLRGREIYSETRESRYGFFDVPEIIEDCPT